MEPAGMRLIDRRCKSSLEAELMSQDSAFMEPAGMRLIYIISNQIRAE